MRDMFLGYRRFEELRRRTGATRGTLTARLKSMVGNDLLFKSSYQEAPRRYEYRLTEKGLDLYPFMLAVWAWETSWSDESHIPPVLTHALCGQNMRPTFRCGECHLPIAMKEVTFKAGISQNKTKPIPARAQRRSRSVGVSVEGVDRRIFHVLDVLGDRWTGLVIAALYFRLRRYDEIAEALGVATNILADRLKLLLSVDVLERIPYQQKPLRHEYRLTEKGTALYNSTLQLHQWASRHLLEPDEKPLQLLHQPCGAEVHSELICSECGEALNASEVTFERNFD
jgi:DNA-binding HxlR family transcriptional regulator